MGSNIFTDGLRRDLEAIVGGLDRLGVTSRHEEFKTINEHLQAAERLQELSARTHDLTAPRPDDSVLLARLIAGEEVDDAELVAYAAQATAAGSKIGGAAEQLVDGAERARLRAARDTLRTIASAAIEDLRGLLPAAAGARPSDHLVRSIRSILTDLDHLLGRGVCDYWLIRDFRADRWVILERDAAEDLNLANEDYVAEQKRLETERRANGPAPIRPSREAQKPRNLRRKPLGSSGFGGEGPTDAEVDTYRAEKDAAYFAPRSDYSRAELARRLTR